MHPWLMAHYTVPAKPLLASQSPTSSTIPGWKEEATIEHLLCASPQPRALATTHLDPPTSFMISAHLLASARTCEPARSPVVIAWMTITNRYVAGGETIVV